MFQEPYDEIPSVPHYNLITIKNGLNEIIR